MKLDHSMSGACAAATLAVALACFACGCSSSAARVASSPAQQQAALDGRTATTQLMSAQLAPKFTVRKILGRREPLWKPENVT